MAQDLHLSLPSHHPEGILWNEFRQSNPEAFRKIYGQYSSNLLQYGRRLCADRMVVQDAIHDLFLDLWKMRENLAENVSIRFYLYRSLRRRLHIQQKQTLHSLPESHIPQTFTISHESLIISGETEERRSQLLSHALSSLSEREMEVVQLRYFQNCTVKDVASLLHIKEQTVRNLLQRAIQKIRKKLPVNALF